MADEREMSGDAGREDVDMSAAPIVEEEAPTPSPQSRRMPSIDVLRGVALLGILVMNIPFFALPEATFFNPTLMGGFEGGNRLVWWIGHLLFDQKMMAIFSMLFGAGIILMTSRAEEKGAKPGGLHYKRMAWLLVFGLLHAYLIWYGDILFAYAICGMLVFPLRRLSPGILIPLGLVVTMIAVPINMGAGLSFGYLRGQAEEAQALIEAGETPSRQQEGMIEAWAEIRDDFHPSEEALAEEIEIHVEGGAALFRHRAENSFWMQTFGMFLWGLWRAAGLMLVGMGLFKLGVFTAALPMRTYAAMSLVGYAVGLPIIWMQATRNIAQEFDVVHLFIWGMHPNYIASVFVALAHVGVVMMICRAAMLISLTDRLAAVGRMAFTNYIMQSVICTTIFYGYGFGLFGKFDRVDLIGVVAIVWVLQLLWSPWWLARFRYGPLEWLWRSLTYGQRQPMRRDGGLM
ncbi:MAG: DUF418 domain-containing protein [Phycisphaeraceae bacterium]|nr:MAG: DUF418 domain-containing protein [Phycisphaeraceae bacterium]